MSKKILPLLLFFFLSVPAKAQVINLHEGFSSCPVNLPAGWLQYSVAGNQVWSCDAQGYSGPCMYMNGYNGGNVQNEDWLISPELDLSTYEKPVFSFYSKTNFNGAAISISVSQNYAGTGNPNMANWTPLVATIPGVNTNEWTYSDEINLSAFKQQPCYVAIKYTSTNAAAASWKVDEVQLSEASINLSAAFVHAGDATAGSPSGAGSLQFTMPVVNGNLELLASPPFEISKNNASFSSQLSYSNAISGIPQTVYVRVDPAQPLKVFRDSLRFLYNTHEVSKQVYVLGTSIADAQSLQVASWNMRWFGSPSWCNCDTALSGQHAIRILKDLNADVYCLQEVVSIPQLAAVCAALGPQYQYRVSEFCSGAMHVNDPFYADCQKLAFIYNTQKIQNLGTFGLLHSTYPTDTLPYYCFGSGRFPFVMKAVTAGFNDTLILVNLHGKASNTQQDYDRRQCAAQYMADSLNALFPGKQVLVIGDYNDYLEGSHVAGQTVSPYQYLLNNGYQGITLPSKYPGQSTYVESEDFLVDNLACSASLMPRYIDSSCFIFTESAKYIPDYVSSSSDHYPVMGYFSFNFPSAVQHVYTGTNPDRFILQNPSGNKLSVKVAAHIDLPCRLRIFDLQGRCLFVSDIQRSGIHDIHIPLFVSGIYLAELQTKRGRSIEKWHLD